MVISLQAAQLTLDHPATRPVRRTRVFGNKPGEYGVGIDKTVQQGKDAGNTVGRTYSDAQRFRPAQDRPNGRLVHDR